MRRFLLIAVLLLLPRAAMAGPVDDCGPTSGNDYQLLIKRCSEIIASKRYAASKPLMALVHMNRGVGYFKSKDLEKALADFTKSVSLEPTADRHRLKAAALFMLKRNDEAIVEAGKVIKLRGNASDYEERALMLDSLEQYASALPDYDAAIERDSRNPELYYRRAIVQSKLGDRSAAIIDLSFAIGLNPNNPVYHYDRGVTYQTQGKCAPAIVDYSRAIAITPGDVKILVNRGICYIRERQYDQAQEDFERVLRLDPTNQKAKANLELVHSLKTPGSSPFKSIPEGGTVGQPMVIPPPLDIHPDPNVKPLPR